MQSNAINAAGITDANVPTARDLRSKSRKKQPMPFACALAVGLFGNALCIVYRLYD